VCVGVLAESLAGGEFSRRVMIRGNGGRRRGGELVRGRSTELGADRSGEASARGERERERIGVGRRGRKRSGESPST
jgi:hypothetical protein